MEYLIENQAGPTPECGTYICPVFCVQYDECIGFCHFNTCPIQCTAFCITDCNCFQIGGIYLNSL